MWSFSRSFWLGNLLPQLAGAAGTFSEERCGFVMDQEVVEDIAHFVLLVVVDKWDGHSCVLFNPLYYHSRMYNNQEEAHRHCYNHIR